MGNRKWKGGGHDRVDSVSGWFACNKVVKLLIFVIFKQDEKQ